MEGTLFIPPIFFPVHPKDLFSRGWCFSRFLFSAAGVYLVCWCFFRLLASLFYQSEVKSPNTFHPPIFRVLVKPSGDLATVISIEGDSSSCSIARDGDNVAVSLVGFEWGHIMPGGA
ncbi:HBS1-like protein [Iris pallida]|uniref:HBS1-like protein n=1 Tax=Iris pallida TaxID=29817 RepID=A0AAX6H7K7_IRIPA|nr:HBS1-like protein [Iris pallida]